MIYCVEDDGGIRNMMLYTLRAAGFEAEGFAEAESFFEALEAKKPRLIMLDIMLPGMDGIEILRRLKSRAADSGIPVIMATAKGSEYDKVTGLDLGADDYLAKPFGMMEMVSRVRAVLRRTAPKEQDALKVGELALYPAEHRVEVAGSGVELTLKEYELLRLLMENLGMVFTRDKLLSSIWSHDYYGETRTVDVHIRTLRSKLSQCGDYIVTVRGVGYRMEAKA